MQGGHVVRRAAELTNCIIPPLRSCTPKADQQLSRQSSTACQQDSLNDQVSRRRAIINAGVGLAVLPCGCPQPVAAEVMPWNYETLEGPRLWGGLCASGRRQSPVDLPKPDNSLMSGKGVQLRMDYETAARLSVVNTGHGNIQVNVSPGSFCSINGRRLQLLQWHFHTPSEHAFGGVRQAMEAHLVHRDVNTGELAVLGILLQRGATNPLNALQIALDNAALDPFQPQTLPQPQNLDQLLRELFPAGSDAGHCEHYAGSLSTPPCSEGVQWYVWMQPGRVTDSQVLDFESAIAARMSLSTNARPLQQLFDRSLAIEFL